MQTVIGLFSGEVRQMQLPAPEDELMPNVRWGDYLNYFTPAYWSAMLWMLGSNSTVLTYKLGQTLKEEAAACMLGGHGITAEMSLAAYDSLRGSGVLTADSVSEREIEALLRKPLRVGDRLIHYRFPRQKALFLAPALNRLSREMPCTSDHRAFRNWFLQFRGVGLKTASWITRNWLDSRTVAILDIHIIRCGRICGFFKPSHNPQRHYIQMEDLYLEFAHRIGADAAKLDAFVWQQMRVASGAGMRALASLAN
jgi:thermostable 8-oxoguanine DNA glycosylase